MNYLPLNDQTEDMAHRVGEPSACGLCGISKRTHSRQWKQGIGWHTWIMPSQEQIKARMLFRRHQ